MPNSIHNMEEFIVTQNGTETNDSASAETGLHEDETGIPLNNGGNKGRHHFTTEEDMALLQLIVERNPFGARGQRGAVWDEIEAALHAMGYDCNIKSCQDRVARLLRTLQSEEAMRKSVCGQTMQSNGEMVQLLEEIVRLKSAGNVGNVVEIKPDRTGRPAERKHATVIRQTTPSTPVIQEHVSLVQPGKRTHEETVVDADLLAPSFKIQRLFTDNGETASYQKQKLALKREELDIHLRQVALAEMRFKKEAELEEFRLKIESDKVEMETRKVGLERDRLDMERRKQDLEIAERTQHLETMRQQQQVLFQLLTKKLNEA